MLVSSPLAPPLDTEHRAIPHPFPIGQTRGGRGTPIPLGGVSSGGVSWLRPPLHLDWSRAAVWLLPEFHLPHTGRPSAHAPSHSSHSPNRAANPAIGQVEEANAGEGDAVWSAVMSVAMAVV